MKIIHLTGSPFFGGPERQMLELARSLPPGFQSVFVSFFEDGLCLDFLEKVQRSGFQAIHLKHDMPRLLAAWRELAALLKQVRADVLCCHGYKADLLGLAAARRAAVPVISVSRGWTGETSRVRLYEALDRRSLGWMDRVVCVSRAQADKVRRAGVAADKTVVIRNAIRTERFARPDPGYRERLQALFPKPCRLIVGAAGRLSPEKGFQVLVDAAAEVAQVEPSSGFVLFGDGTLREELASQIEARRLNGRFVLAGFRSDLDQYLPHLDVLVLPSFTEGLPNVVLEALAAAVPVVATAVGGTPEVVEDGVSGFLVSAGDSTALARRVHGLLCEDKLRQAMGRAGRRHVRQQFTFDAQMRRYRRLFEDLTSACAT